jgi:tetratricopeptide (TPR) repeat protein
MATPTADRVRPPASPFAEWFDAPVFEALSSDGQVYYRCEKCAAVARLEFTPTLPKRGDYSCPRCEGALAPIRFRAMGEANCLDAGHRFDYEQRPWDVLRCPVCFSRAVEFHALPMDPPYPAVFGSVGFIAPPAAYLSAQPVMRDHPWGESVMQDAARLRELCDAYYYLPSRLAHVAIYALYLLGDRLAPTYMAISAADRASYAWTLSFLLKRFFEMTADSIAIDSSLALEQLAESFDPADPVLVALSRHNFAIRAIDALELIGESELGMMGLADLRSQAIAAAESALATVRSTPGRGNAELQAARIEYAIADLLRRGSPTPEELTRAIAIYDRVLQRDDMGHTVLFMTVGRAFAVMQLGVVGDGASLLAAAQTLQNILCGKDPLAIGRRSTWAAMLGREFLQRDALNLAIPVLESAVTFAQKDTRPIYDRARMTRDAEKEAAAYTSLATAYVHTGKPDEALSLLETWRGRVLTSRRLTSDERNAAAVDADAVRDERHFGWWSAEESPPLIMADEAMRERQMGRVFGPFEDFYELKGLFPALEKFMSTAERRRTILIEVALDTMAAGQTVASAIVNAADRSKGTNGWFSYQWAIAPEDDATLRSTLHLRPGAFQEERLTALAKVGARTLLQPMKAAFMATIPDLVVLCLPGALSNLPIEAFAEAARQDDPTVPWPKNFVYAPSLAIVAKSGISPPLDASSRILVVGYHDHDLASAEAEVAEVVAAFQGRADVVAAGSTKRNLIDALNSDYAAVHFVCHGTYEANAPLDSALLLRRYDVRDIDRLTAAEIREFVRFKRAPMVTLSACSTALTAESRTNTWHGLPGSLIEAGARCVIGSRWPVDDEVAKNTMVSLYQTLLASPMNVTVALRSIQDQIAVNGAIKDWSCFGVLHG